MGSGWDRGRHRPLDGLVTAPAGATGTPPQISVVTGSAGTKTVTLGHPQKATTAKLSPGYVAYNPANGDEAVSVRTGGGKPTST